MPSPQDYRNNLMIKICEAVEANVPTGVMAPADEHRVQAIYVELSAALGLPEGRTWVDED